MILLGKILIGLGAALVAVSWACAAVASGEAPFEGVERPYGAFFHSLSLHESHLSPKGVRFRAYSIKAGAAGFSLAMTGLVLWAAAL